MNQISEALRASRAEKAAKLAKRVGIAFRHLPRVLGEMNNGRISTYTRQEAIDHLIRDGMLGARGNAHHIAHAKKYGLPLNAFESQLANTIVNRALELAERQKLIIIKSTRTSFEIRLTHAYEASDSTLSDAILDADEIYTLQEHLPSHRAQRWGIHKAHE